MLALTAAAPLMWVVNLAWRYGSLIDDRLWRVPSSSVVLACGSGTLALVVAFFGRPPDPEPLNAAAFD